MSTIQFSISRVAIFAASSRFGLSPIVMKCVGVSARGCLSGVFLWTTTWISPFNDVSIAERHTSPYPCAA